MKKKMNLASVLLKNKSISDNLPESDSNRYPNPMKKKPQQGWASGPGLPAKKTFKEKGVEYERDNSGKKKIVDKNGSYKIPVYDPAIKPGQRYKQKEREMTKKEKDYDTKMRRKYNR